MKKKLLIFLCLIFVLVSCKKNDEVIPPNTFSATVDGVNINFNVGLRTSFGGAPGGSTTLYIGGTSTNDYTGKALGISLTSFDYSAIKKGTFVSSSFSNPAKVLAYISLNNNSDPISNNDFFYTDTAGIKLSTITINSITTTNVQGTFSGTLVYYKTTKTSTKTITNGKFNATLE